MPSEGTEERTHVGRDEALHRADVNEDAHLRGRRPSSVSESLAREEDDE